MSLLSGFELVFVLLAIGILLLLSIRFRIQKSTAMFLVIIAVLFLGLISLSKLAMTLFGTTLLLAIVVALLIVMILRRSNSAKIRPKIRDSHSLRRAHPKL
jgi:hypothetical protein